MPQKIYNSILKFIKIFYVHFGHFFPFHQIGIWLYTLAGFICCKYLIYKIPEIQSIYQITNYHDNWFQPGISDLDLLPVLKDAETKLELETIKKVNRARNLLGKIFPFVWLGGSPFFEIDFKFWYRINTDYIHHRQKYLEMKLIYGSEIRPNVIPIKKQKMSGSSLRFFYEEMLGNIYYNILFQKNNYRIFYKFFKIYVQAGYTMEKTHQAPALESPQIQAWLAKTGCQKKFITKIINLKQKKFFCSDSSFNIEIIYNLIKITEYLTDIYKEKKKKLSVGRQIDTVKLKQGKKIPPFIEISNFVKALPKDNIKSIVLTKNILSSLLETFSFYIVYQTSNSFNFRKQIGSFLNNLHHLKNLMGNIKLQHRSALFLTKNVFPIILTEKILEFDTFVNADCFYEALNINSNQLLLYGYPLKIKINSHTVEKAWHFTINLALNSVPRPVFEALIMAILRNEILHQNQKFDFSQNLAKLYESVFKEKKPDNFETFYCQTRNLIKNNYYSPYLKKYLP
ncbi:MAG: hypothetical protein WC893_03220 [Candidatus Paceibacterota bacterium]